MVSDQKLYSMLQSIISCSDCKRLLRIEVVKFEVVILLQQTEENNSYKISCFLFLAWTFKVTMILWMLMALSSVML